MAADPRSLVSPDTLRRIDHLVREQGYMLTEVSRMLELDYGDVQKIVRRLYDRGLKDARAGFRAKAVAWSKDNIGVPIEVGAQQLDVPERHLRRVLATKLVKHGHVAATTPTPAWSLTDEFKERVDHLVREQGYLMSEIARMESVPYVQVRQAAVALYPGGVREAKQIFADAMIAWAHDHPEASVEDQSGQFGVPVENLRRVFTRNNIRRHTNPSPRQPSVRGQKMVEQYIGGDTLAEVGATYGLTRERARQIISKIDPGARAKRQDRIDQAKVDEQARFHQRVLSWSGENPYATLNDGSEQLGISVGELRSHLGRSGFRHLDVSSNRGQKIWDDSEIVSHLQQYVADTGDTTGSGMDEWSHGHDDRPGIQTVINRFGSWSAGMALAGFEVASVERDRRYTQADLVAAVVDYLNSDQQSWTAAGYERWQRTIEGMPSLALIRGQGQMTWYEMAQAAILVIESDPSLDPEWIYEVSRRRDWPSMIPVHSEDELISHLRDFVDQFPGARATRVSFDRWARENGRPSSNMIVSRAKSSWSSLVIAAGGTVSFEKRETYDDEHLLISVAIFLAEHPDGSYQSYERWAREKGFPTPSTILVRFGGWSVAKQKASERIV